MFYVNFTYISHICKGAVGGERVFRVFKVFKVFRGEEGEGDWKGMGYRGAMRRQSMRHQPGRVVEMSLCSGSVNDGRCTASPNCEG